MGLSQNLAASLGSFSFSYPYRIRATHLSGMAEGDYNSSIVTSGSSFAPDNKTIAVVMHVTSRPVAQVSPERLRLRLAQNAPKQTAGVQVTNAGSGNLTVSNFQVATTSGGNWLSMTPNPFFAGLYSIDVSTLAPGVYQGSLMADTNAANGSVTIPVELEVVPQAAPVGRFQGVVNNATFQAGEPIAQGALAAIFGEQFSFAGPASGTQLPLATQLGGTRVLVNGQPAPLFYNSYSQVNFQIPYQTPAGTAEIRVERDGQAGNAVSVDVVPQAPRLLRLGILDYGIITNQDGSFPLPAATALLLGIRGHPAKPGDVLTIYAIGLGPATPPVATGAAAPAAEPLARVNATVTFGGGFMGSGITVHPFFVGLTPGLVGLYQINVIVPQDAPRTENTGLSIEMNGMISNSFGWRSNSWFCDFTFDRRFR